MDNPSHTQHEEQQFTTLADFMAIPLPDFVDQLYQIILGREADSAGRSHYLAALFSGTQSRVEILDELVRSPEGTAGGYCQLPGLREQAKTQRMISRLPLLKGLVRLIRRISIAASLGQAMALQQPGQNLSSSRPESRQPHLQTLGERQHQAEVRLGILEADLNSIRLETRRAIAEYRRYLLALEPAALPLETPGPVVSAEAVPSDFGNSIYASFEDEFRGTPEQVRQGLAPYLPLVQEAVLQHPGLPVVDLGCGRGEWLDLLTEERIRVKGADLNPAVTGPLVQQGFDVVQADVFSYLAGLPDASAAVVTSFHLIEHLPPEQWIPLLDQIRRVLAPGGLAIIETPNPRNILVGSGEFYRDPSHRTPVFPDTLSFFGRVRGFDDSMAWYFVDDRSALVPADSWRFDTLDDYVRISRDYAWIGRKNI